MSINLYTNIYIYVTSFCKHTFLFTHVVMRLRACVWHIFMYTLFTTIARYTMMRCERYQGYVSPTFSVVSYRVKLSHVSRIAVPRVPCVSRVPRIPRRATAPGSAGPGPG